MSMTDAVEGSGPLSALIGERFSGVGQAAGMGVFEFGVDLTDVDPELGVGSRGAKYALHVQCAFRLTRNGFVVLGSTDQRWLGKGGSGSQSMFDVRAQAIDGALAKSPHIVVREISLSGHGDLGIILTNGVGIDIFIDSSRPSEQWRFLQRFGEHLIFPGRRGGE
ncbi:hypothetical protein ACFP2T_46730 [Plantactinospora solaniradicis]|uniref:Uncharacterized protein n=1 Tax=Plantactinospora solaniradicis TaxID=1723736 RepID=A0ABW1KSI9_9ACTN